MSAAAGRPDSWLLVRTSSRFNAGPSMTLVAKIHNANSETSGGATSTMIFARMGKFRILIPTSSRTGACFIYVLSRRAAVQPAAPGLARCNFVGPAQTRRRQVGRKVAYRCCMRPSARRSRASSGAGAARQGHMKQALAADGAVLDADGLPTGGQHLDLHAPPALGAEAGRLEGARRAAGDVVALGERAAAPVAPAFHETLDRGGQRLDGHAELLQQGEVFVGGPAERREVV